MLVLKKHVSTLGPRSFFGEMAFSPMRHAWRPLLREKTRSVLFCLNPPSSDCWKKIPPLNAGWNHSRPNAWQNLNASKRRTSAGIWQKLVEPPKLPASQQKFYQSAPRLVVATGRLAGASGAFRWRSRPYCDSPHRQT